MFEGLRRAMFKFGGSTVFVIRKIRCAHLPEVLLVSQLVFLLVSLCCADFEVHRTPGLRMMSSFNFILRCFQHIQFDSPMLLDSSVWIQIVAPPSDVSVIVFWHLALQQSKRNRTK